MMRERVARLLRSYPGAAWYALAIASCLPLFVVEHPPLQDLPFHLAAIRVIHSHGDPAFGLSDDFVLTLGSTQYVLYYLVASGLAYVLGIVHANLLLVCVYLGGTTLAMRDLARALGRDERVALFVPPLLVNVMFLFGLLPFLVAIPVMLWAIAASIRYFAQPTVARGVLVAVVGASLFCLHVFPFALFALGFAAEFPWRRTRQWLVAGLPALPSIGLVLWWTLLTPEGRLARGALIHPERPSTLSPLGKLKDSFNWLGDVFRDLSDEILYGVTAGLAVLAIVIAWRTRARWTKSVWAYALVPLTCIFFFATGGEQQGHIWLIWQRFPLLFVLTVVPLLPFPGGARGRALAAALTCVALATTISACVHFVRFERDDTDDFDAVLRTMQPRKHVAGLIFDKQSSVTHRHPLVHFASYYQLEKGGVVEFTFAGYPHWPFQFREGRCPSTGCPARQDWEWTPEQVTTAELYPYFDYVLTRGAGFAPAPGTYHVANTHGRWTVWERDGAIP